MKQHFFLGSYTESILFGTGEIFVGKGNGISVYEFENGKGKLVNEISTSNPSFLCINESQQKIYAVNETKEYLGEEGGGITEISYDNDFNLTVQSNRNVGGKDPCHIEIAPNLEFLATANFHSGSVSIFPLDKKGNISKHQPKVFKHEGNSIHPIRQKEAHAHSCIFEPNANIFYVPDLGIDQIVAYEYLKKDVKLHKSYTIALPQGSGPRYGEFSNDGKHFYLINELSSEVVHFTNYEHKLFLQDKHNTLPIDFNGENICSDLHITPDGTKLYASNRGHDSIVCFDIQNDGKLEFIERQPCGGHTPRNFAIDPVGKYLLVGNQDSDNISVFKIRTGGHLNFISDILVGSPACIKFIKFR